MKISYPKQTITTLNIDSFDAGLNTSKDAALTNMNYAVRVDNFAFKNGALTNGIGFKSISEYLKSEDSSLMRELESIGGIEKVFYFYKYNEKTNKREDKLLFVTDLYRIYYINLFDNNKQLNSLRAITFTSLPVAVRYRLSGDDVIILSSETDNMVVWDGINEPYSVLDSPRISSMTIHFERLFATVDGEKNSVWFSDDLDPTNWTISLNEAGYIELIDERGALLKVVSFCDYLYIFREYGISRLSAFGDQTNFSVSNLFVSSGKIYESSVCVCGDKIIFLAEDGLYSFDGVNTVRILSSISENLKDLDNSNCSACYQNGNYFLACKLRFYEDDDKCINENYSNAILEIDAYSNKLLSITHGVYVKYILAVQSPMDAIIALTKDDAKNAFLPTILCKNAQYLDKNLKKLWFSPTTNLGNGYNKKTLRKIYVETTSPCSILIKYDSKEKRLNFKASKKPQTKRVNLPFFNFSFVIENDSDECNIKNLLFEFSKSQTY